MEKLCGTCIHWREGDLGWGACQHPEMASLAQYDCAIPEIGKNRPDTPDERKGAPWRVFMSAGYRDDGRPPMLATTEEFGCIMWTEDEKKTKDLKRYERYREMLKE